MEHLIGDNCNTNNLNSALLRLKKNIPTQTQMDTIYYLASQIETYKSLIVEAKERYRALLDATEIKAYNRAHPNEDEEVEDGLQNQ